MVVLASFVSAEAPLEGNAYVYLLQDEPTLTYTLTNDDGIFSVTLNGVGQIPCSGEKYCQFVDYSLENINLGNLCTEKSYTNQKLQVEVTDMLTNKYTFTLDKSNGFIAFKPDNNWVEDPNMVALFATSHVCGSELLEEALDIEKNLVEVEKAYNHISDNFAAEPNKNNDLVQAEYLEDVKPVLFNLDDLSNSFNELKSDVGPETVLDTLFKKIDQKVAQLENDLEALETQITQGEEFACAKLFGEVKCISVTDDALVLQQQKVLDDLKLDVADAIEDNNKDELSELRSKILANLNVLQTSVIQFNTIIKQYEVQKAENPDVQKIIDVLSGVVTSFNNMINDYNALLAKVDVALGLKPVQNPNTAPTADFTVGAAVVNQAVPFTGIVSDANNDALTYVWNFGDTATSTVLSPTHTYTATGAYTVTFTVSDGKAQTTATKTVTVAATPAPTTDAAKFKELQDRFDKLEKDWFKLEDDYEEAVDDDDKNDIDDAEDDLRDLEDDLQELEDDVKDFKRATTDNKLEDDAQDLQDDINDVLDDIDKILHPEKFESSSGDKGFTPSDNSNSYTSPSTTSGKKVTVGTTTQKTQPENVQVQVVDTPVMPQQPVISTTPAVDTPVEVDFKDSPVYIALVIGLVIVLLGLVGFMVAMLMVRK